MAKTSEAATQTLTDTTPDAAPDTAPAAKGAAKGTGKGPDAAAARPTTAQGAGAAGAARAGQVKFDTSQLKSSYCNVCNGSSTREEVVLNFGVNTTWDLGREQLEVALQHRIVMSPHAAKRVRDMMIRLIDEHEARHGKLDG